MTIDQFPSLKGQGESPDKRNALAKELRAKGKTKINLHVEFSNGDEAMFTDHPADKALKTYDACNIRDLVVNFTLSDYTEGE